MRQIDEIILHCTATPEGRPVSVAEIDRWHKDRGWSGIGYHYVIHLDGKVEPGRPVERVGAHVKNHNERTVGVVYVGGVDATGKAKDTRTKEQKEAFTKLIGELDRRFSFKKLSGHYEYANKDCPSFDVAPYRKLLASAKSNFAVEPDRVLQKGDTGPAVAAWREKLARAGYEILSGDTFDSLTEQATRWFQAKRDIVIDGVVGPQTEEEMMRFLEGLEPYQVLDSEPSEMPLFESKAVVVMGDLMRDFDLGLEDTAAILGNIGHECAGFEQLSQIGGTAYGWVQWDGVRRKAYFAWCAKNALDKASDEANYGYLVEELRTTEKHALDALAGAVGLDAKTVAFERSFERSGKKHDESRQKYARRALAAYNASVAGRASPHAGRRGRVETIAELQRSLNFLGADVGEIDNVLGPRTEAAIRRFQSLSRLPVTGEASAPVMAAVQAVYLALGGR